MPPFDPSGVFARSPNPYMVLDRALRYVAANPAYLRVTGSRLEDLLGHHVFERFPNDPDDPDNLPRRMLQASFERVLSTGQPDTLALLPYRVPRRTDDGRQVEEERFWSATHTPLLGEDGRVAFILQHTVDITELHRLRAAAHAAPVQGEGLGADVHVAHAAGVLGRAQEVQDANRRLAEAHARLSALFAQAPSFMAVLRGPTYVFELANQAYVRLVGERPLLGLPLHEALPEVAGQGYFELLERVCRTGQAHVGRASPVRLRRGEGAALEEAFVDFIYQPILEADGRVWGVFAQGHDVTEATRALHALQQSEARLRTLVDANLVGVITWDIEGGVLDANDAFLEALGYTRQDLRAGCIDWRALTPPEWHAQDEALVERLRRTGKHPPAEKEYVRRDGSRMPLIVTSSFFPGSTREGVAFVLDISERKAAEAALRESEAAFRRLADNLPDVIARFDRASRHLYVSPSVQRATGRPPEDFIGRTNAELGMPPELVARWDAALERAFAGEESVHAFSFTGPTGERHFEGQLIPERSADGTGVETVLNITRDVTAHVLRAREARERVRLQEQLVGMVSHDLRNPLQAVGLAAAALVRLPELDARALRLAGRILAATERAHRLVADLLDFTQVRLGGGLPVHPAPTNVHDVVDAALEEVRAAWPERDVRASHAGDGAGAWDAGRIAQVVGNLVTNALKYGAPDAPVQVRVRGEGEGVTLEVHNTGEPIPAALLPHVFEPLQRGTHAEGAGGAGRSIGLGLFIVRELVGAHGGQVTAESSAQAGTTFRVWLPRGVPAAGHSPRDDAAAGE